ncbi:uncharacterized protein LOC135500845 [Lineus longissimus]|uniref:uncharacterized protein LOC135500845 n=1 Tax=Lineus longissimus TaxID=88925 RepID=UPI002B4F175C
MFSRFTLRIFGRTGHRTSCTVRSLVKIAGRPGLVDVESPTHPQFVDEFKHDFPYRIDVTGVMEKLQLETYSREFRPKLDKLLLEYGAVLIRGLPLDTANDFSKFFLSLGHEPQPYMGGAANRSQVAAGVVDTGKQEESDEDCIEPHCEMAYTHNFPHMFFLFAEVAPSPGCGGESGITDMRDVLRTLDPEVVEKFTKLGVRYHRCLPDRNNQDAPHRYSYWQTSLLTDSRDEAELRLKETGHSPDQYRWNEEGTLSFWTNCPAVRPHHRTGEMMWFNQSDLSHWSYFKKMSAFYDVFKDEDPLKYPFTSFYGDGTEIELDVIRHIRETMWRCTKVGQLKQGDVLVLDNMRVGHSKLGFTGARVLRVALSMYTAAE